MAGFHLFFYLDFFLTVTRRAVQSGTINPAAAPLPGLTLQPKAGRGRAGPLLHILNVHNKKKGGGGKLTLHSTLQSSLACYNRPQRALHGDMKNRVETRQ